LRTGDTLWDATLASPHGRTELDRLVDIDAAVRVVGDNVFAAGYQGRTAMLALDSGQLWWSHDMSSYRGLNVDDENLYVSETDGTVVALRQRDGSEVWRNEKIKRRGLSAPVVINSAIVVADYQGYVHWLDKNTGALVARARVAKQRVSNPPVGAGDTVVVLTDGGTLAAFRATPRPAPAPAAVPVAPAGAVTTPATVTGPAPDAGTATAPAPAPAPAAAPATAPTPAPTLGPAPAPANDTGSPGEASPAVPPATPTPPPT
jgi:hypothetical protein